VATSENDHHLAYLSTIATGYHRRDSQHHGYIVLPSYYSFYHLAEIIFSSARLMKMRLVWYAGVSHFAPIGFLPAGEAIGKLPETYQTP
jgi:hypothetical protein